VQAKRYVTVVLCWKGL